MSVFTRYDAPMSIQYHVQASKLLNADYWVVINPFIYRLDNMQSKLYVTVPTGFLTDGASVPRIIWNVIPPWGKYGQAAVLHDYMCEYGQVSNSIGMMAIDRKRCDSVFLQAMEVLEVRKFTRSLLSMGVTMYRTIFNPSTPNTNELKSALEYEIMRGYTHTGSFILTHGQVSNLKTKFKLK